MQHNLFTSSGIEHIWGRAHYSAHHLGNTDLDERKVCVISFVLGEDLCNHNHGKTIQDRDGQLMGIQGCYAQVRTPLLSFELWFTTVGHHNSFDFMFLHDFLSVPSFAYVNPKVPITPCISL